MKLGYFIPHIGPAASPENMVRVAQQAEASGFASLWVTDRLMVPTNPRNPYVASPDGKLPDAYKRVFDPIGSLTFVAAHTKTIGLGTSVLDIPFYNPVVLSRQLATLDVVSGGRLRAGFGLGWSEDEYEATGASAKERGKRADEFLEVLHALWKDSPVEYHGKYFNVANSTIDLNPVQKPHPPIYLAAYAPAAMKRVARYADGWFPVGVPVDGMRQMWDAIKSMAREEGRNPDDLKLIVRGNINLTDAPMGEGRWPFSGSADEIRGDIAAVRELGPEELAIDATFSTGVNSVEGFLSVMEKVRELAG